jgi:hypothetical protein
VLGGNSKDKPSFSFVRLRPRSGSLPRTYSNFDIPMQSAYDVPKSRQLRSAVKRLAAAVFLTLMCLAFVAQAAEEPAGFAGTWILDKDKSDPFPRSQTAVNTSVGDVSTGGRGMGMPGGGMGGGGGFGRGGGFGGGAGVPGGGGGFGRGGAGAPGAGGPVPLLIEQNGNEVKLIVKMQMNGQEMPFIETLTCDGKQRENMVPIPNSQDKIKEKIKATLKNNKLIVERITFGPPPQNMQTLTKRSYSISKDGKTMTLETTTSNYPRFCSWLCF